MKKLKQIGIAGSGFAGAVLARELADSGEFSITVFEDREHLGGNCFTTRDAATGVMIHQYGPHIFHTNREDVWEYINRYGIFGPYTNRVKAVTSKGIFSLPINLLTINQFFSEKLNPQEAQEFVNKLGDKSINEAHNFEEQALKFLGRELYNAFFYGYTKKQWGVEPTELPASILQRLPVRFNYDDNYYNSRFQGIPMEGYTPIITKILDHPQIELKLKTPFLSYYKKDFFHSFYSGPMDAYFDFKLGKLQYRTLTFDRFEAEGDFQGNPVINYCEESVPYTRITEHKHFTPWESHKRTVYFKEYSKLTEAGDIPYYPLRLTKDKELLKQYIDFADAEKNVSFIGRLGTYRYLDMHMVIGESLDYAKKILKLNPEVERWPTFTTRPI